MHKFIGHKVSYKMFMDNHAYLQYLNSNTIAHLMVYSREDDVFYKVEDLDVFDLGEVFNFSVERFYKFEDLYVDLQIGDAYDLLRKLDK